MPQTTIYVAPRLSGAPDNSLPAVSTLELARLFGRSAALAGVSLRVETGRIVGLLGANGAGKTTLLRILATAIRPSFGSAQVDGLDVARDGDVVRSRIAYLSHANGLYDDLTAAENLRFAPHSVVLLDEPHAALDEEGMRLVDELIGRWREAGITVVVASHAIDRLAPLLDGSVRLDAGLIAAIEGDGVSHNTAPNPFATPV